jgi:chromosome segregation ATPase
MNLIFENIAIITTLRGGLLGWFVGGRQKQDIEIKKSNSDAVKSMQEVYDTFLEDFKQRVADLMQEVEGVKAHNKELQRQFNEIYLQYTRESEKSAAYGVINKELNAKYNELDKHYESLKLAHDKLKKEFEEYKKKHK